MPKRAKRRSDSPTADPPESAEPQMPNESRENSGPPIEFKPANADRILSEVISEAAFTLSSALKSVSSVTISEPNNLELGLRSSHDFQRRVLEQQESRASITAIIKNLTGVTAAILLKNDLTPEEFTQTIKSQSEEFAEKSTQLSQMLEKAESFLQQMPGRFELDVGNSEERLAFRRSRNEWSLFYEEYSEDYGCESVPVTTASVMAKAKAALLLPTLFQAILETSTLKLDAVNEGLKAVQGIPFLKEDK